jgi:hypothetical protein
MSSFSAYLVGLYDRRNGATTKLHIINPTTKDLNIISAFYDDEEKCQRCFKFILTANDLEEIDVNVPLKKVNVQFGVVKIISLDPETEKPKDGIVGFQRQLRGSVFTETILASVPTEVAHDELPKIREDCQKLPD